VIDNYAAQWRAEGIDDVAVCATSAVRDAANATRFLRAVERATGVTPVVLSGVEEAELTFAGGVAGMPGRHVVCDIGGGSTELIVGQGTPEHRVSLQLGSVRLRERHLHNDPPTVEEYAALIADVDAVLAGQPGVYAAEDDTPLIAVAGTATTLAAVAARVGPDMAGQIDNMLLTTAELAQVIERLAWLPARRRLLHPAIVPGREDVVVAGGLLLARVLDRFGFKAVRVRVADLLDGVAVRLAADDWPQAGSRVSA
jgi:exopolyphosphatase/guanosine-5'-triphosphate,3'-diphosphate pyrophosphatase